MGLWQTTREKGLKWLPAGCIYKRKIKSHVFIFKTNIETFHNHPRPGHILCILDWRPVTWLLDFWKILRQKTEMAIKDYKYANVGLDEDKIE